MGSYNPNAMTPIGHERRSGMVPVEASVSIDQLLNSMKKTLWELNNSIAKTSIALKGRDLKVPTLPKNLYLYKTEMCNFYASGRCKYGDNCSYAHGIEELRSCPALRSHQSSLPLAKNEAQRQYNF